MLERKHASGSLGLLGLSAAAVAALVLGCATPGLPPGEGASTLTAQTVRRAQAIYLYPDRLDRRFLAGALDALERRFDTVRFEEGESHGVLSVGSARAQVPLGDAVEPESIQEILGRALHFVEQGLEEELAEDEDLELIALRGALHSLDRYSTIFAGRSTEDFKIHFSGKLKGIGSRIGRRDGRLLAVTVFPGSPAEKGGLKDGDAILAIDGEPTQPLSVSEAVGRIRGEEGTRVRFSILREDEGLEIEIVRGEVIIPTVEARLLEDRIGYVRIFHMSRSTVKEFRRKIDELGELSGLVLDLRGNSGGSMKTATALADLFLAKDTILRVVDRKDPTSRNPGSRAMAKPKVAFPFPVAVLVDSVTASGAEILAGALAPLPRVQLIGQRTFGKGLIQRVFPLPDKHMLKLTVAEYILSDDRAIHKQGIEPDITLYPVSTERLSRLANVVPNTIPYLRAPGEDDTLPIDVGQALLSDNRDESFAEVRAKANADITEHLSQADIPWMGDTQGLPEVLPKALEIKGESLRLVAGEPAKLHVQVRNPNDFAIPNAWATLEAPTDYLGSPLLALGDLARDGVARGEIEFTPPKGLSAPLQPVTVHVASGARPLQSQRLMLHVTYHIPEIEISVERSAVDRVEVTLQNRGEFGLSGIHIAVPGAASTIEELAPDATTKKELPLSGEVESVAVTLRGPGVRRQVEVPIPEKHVEVVPPAVVLERVGFPGRPKLRVRATSSEGLEVGWIFLDGQKEVYAEWGGQRKGQLQTQLKDGDHHVTARIETLSGVAVTETWHLTAN
jgi:carboxyl-terminal processing protease